MSAHSALPTAVGPTAAGAVLPCGRGAEPGGCRAGQPGRAEGPPALHAACQPVPLLPGEGQGGWRGRQGAQLGGAELVRRGGLTVPLQGNGGNGGPAEKGVGLRGAAPELSGGDLPAARSRRPCWEFLRPSNHSLTSWTTSVERQRGGSFAEFQSLLSLPACASPRGEVGAWVCVRDHRAGRVPPRVSSARVLTGGVHPPLSSLGRGQGPGAARVSSLPGPCCSLSRSLPLHTWPCSPGGGEAGGGLAPWDPLIPSPPGPAHCMRHRPTEWLKLTGTSQSLSRKSREGGLPWDWMQVKQL